MRWLSLASFVALALLAAYAVARMLLGQRDRRTVLLASLRAGIFCLALLAIFNPAWMRLANQPHKSHLLVLHDVSASMDLAGVSGQPRATEVAGELASAGAQQAMGRFHTTTVPFATGLDATQRQQTDVAQALRQGIARFSPEAVVVISDGAATTGDARAAAAEAHLLGSTVSTVGVGSLTAPMDIGPVTVAAPRVVKENQPFGLNITVLSSAYSGPQGLELSRDGQVIARPRVTLSGGKGQLHIQAPGLAAGYHLLTVRALPHPGEATLTNNEKTVLIEARRDQTRMVVLAGGPSPEYANLKRALTGLPKMDIDWHVRVARDAWVHEVGETPQRETLNVRKTLDKRHVVVLVNIEAAALETAAIRDFVLQGGALALLGGPRAFGAGGYASSALAAVSPVRSAGTDYSPVPLPVAAPNAATPLGKDLALAVSPPQWLAAPFLSGANRVSPAPASTVILRARSGLPLVVTGSAGLGRTLAVATDGTFRWVLSPQADDRSRRLHEVFWQTLASWLAQPRDDRRVLLMLDPPVAPYGQPVRALVQVSEGLQPITDAQVTLRVQRPGQPETLACRPTAVPGRYQTAIGNLDPGTYAVSAEATRGGTIGKDERKLVVEPGGVELSRLTLQEGTLREIAAAGGGRYAPLAQLGQLLQDLPAPAQSRQVPVESRPWRSWWAFVAILALCTVEWVLRRRWGA